MLLSCYCCVKIDASRLGSFVHFFTPKRHFFPPSHFSCLNTNIFQGLDHWGWANGTQGWTQTRGRFCPEQIFVVCFSWSSSYGLLAEEAALLSKNQNKEKDEIRISSIAAAAIYWYRIVYFPSRKWRSRHFKSYTSSSNNSLNCLKDKFRSKIW